MSMSGSGSSGVGSGTMTTPTESGYGSAVMRVHSGLSRQSEVPVMFTDKHVRELHPADFKQLPRHRVGKGSYGTVYRAEWRGLTVAVKVIELPTQPQYERVTARQAHIDKLKKVTKDFVAEVDVGCELLHPNLVQMLGCATFRHHHHHFFVRFWVTFWAHCFGRSSGSLGTRRSLCFTLSRSC